MPHDTSTYRDVVMIVLHGLYFTDCISRFILVCKFSFIAHYLLINENFYVFLRGMTICPLTVL